MSTPVTTAPHEFVPKLYRIIPVFSGWFHPLRFRGSFTAEEAAPMVCDWNAVHEAHEMVMMEEIKEDENVNQLF